MPALEGIPVIITTARDLSLAGTGAVAMFQKPFDHDELLSAIRSALG